MAAILERRIPHCPGEHDEGEDPGPRGDGRGRLGTARREYLTQAALVGVNQDWNASVDDFLLAQADHGDAGTVPHDEGNLLVPRCPVAFGCPHAQHVWPIRQIAGVEFELARRLEGGAGGLLVVDKDLDSHLRPSSSSRIRHFTWSVDVSPGYRVWRTAL